MERNVLFKRAEKKTVGTERSFLKNRKNVPFVLSQKKQKILFCLFCKSKKLF